MMIMPAPPCPLFKNHALYPGWKRLKQSYPPEIKSVQARRSLSRTSFKFRLVSRQTTVYGDGSAARRILRVFVFLGLRRPFQHILDLLRQAFHIGETAIDRGKADVGHSVELLEPSHDLFPHDLAAHLRFA